MAAGLNKRRLIQHAVFQELCKVRVLCPVVNIVTQGINDAQELIPWGVYIYVYMYILV